MKKKTVAALNSCSTDNSQQMLKGASFKLSFKSLFTVTRLVSSLDQSALRFCRGALSKTWLWQHWFFEQTAARLAASHLDSNFRTFETLCFVNFCGIWSTYLVLFSVHLCRMQSVSVVTNFPSHRVENSKIGRISERKIVLKYSNRRKHDLIYVSLVSFFQILDHSTRRKYRTSSSRKYDKVTLNVLTF